MIRAVTVFHASSFSVVILVPALLGTNPGFKITVRSIIEPKQKYFQSLFIFSKQPQLFSFTFRITVSRSVEKLAGNLQHLGSNFGSIAAQLFN